MVLSCLLIVKNPGGTGHAILVAQDVIDEPFAVINADDYYGIDSFKVMADFLSGKEVSPSLYSMVGFVLRNTLSEYGTVARGVCECDDKMFMKKVVERTKIEKVGDAARYYDSDDSIHELTGDEIVSMNLWGVHQSIFEHLRVQFKDFLSEFGNEKKTEFYIPSVIDSLYRTARQTSGFFRLMIRGSA